MKRYRLNVVTAPSLSEDIEWVRYEDVAVLIAVARELVAKLDACKPYIDAAFSMGAIHGGRYDGPSYGTELEAVRVALPKEGQP